MKHDFVKPIHLAHLSGCLLEWPLLHYSPDSFPHARRHLTQRLYPARFPGLDRRTRLRSGSCPHPRGGAHDTETQSGVSQQATGIIGRRTGTAVSTHERHTARRQGLHPDRRHAAYRGCTGRSRAGDRYADMSGKEYHPDGAVCLAGQLLHPMRGGGIPQDHLLP